MSNRLYIPQLKDRIRLTQDWTFRLHGEGRNNSLFAFLKGSGMPLNENHRRRYYDASITYESRTVTLKAGCLLEVDRIYIRQGQEGFDSITFKLLEIPESMKEDVTEVKRGKTVFARFWTKIHDANNIYFEPATEPDVDFNL